jgi:hypothetical protein
MLRYSKNQLVWATAMVLVFIGLALEAMIFTTELPRYLSIELFFGTIAVGPILIGVGLFLPFYGAAIGAAIGFVVGAMLALYVLAGNG